MPLPFLSCLSLTRGRIIVGVKYCFRYNARNRQLRMEASGDPVALENMPRPHRRRREKKLMTMDEVNEKFPMQKYKNWVAARAQEGLSTMGGISALPSRANSVRSVEGVAPEVPSKERDSDDQRPMTSASTRRTLDETASDEAQDLASKSARANRDSKDAKKDEPTGSAAETNQAAGASTTTAERANLERVESEDDNDDEHINAALPPECIGTSGDACAICIETLEDDDDVRGLTCGHAFHAVCLDPWLTSRRACCPLCKADYYTPKPRPPPADANANVENNGNGSVIFAQLRDSRRTPESRHGFQPFVTLLPARFRRSRQNTHEMQQEQRPRSQRTGTQSTPLSPAQQQQLSPSVPSAETREAGSGNLFSNFRPSIPRVRLPRLPQLRRNRQADGESTQVPPAPGATAVTPSQLEAGTRSPAVTTAA